MSEQPPTPDKADIAVKLDAERRREIDDVRKNFEAFYREEIQFQAEMKADMAVVKEQQKGLKERFEEGVSKRLAGLDHKFDQFLIEWGKKQEQDKTRDNAINSVDKKADNANKNFIFLIRASILSAFGSLLVAAIIWALKTF